MLCHTVSRTGSTLPVVRYRTMNCDVIVSYRYEQCIYVIVKSTGSDSIVMLPDMPKKPWLEAATQGLTALAPGIVRYPCGLFYLVSIVSKLANVSSHRRQSLIA